jgi:hypothetical protein
MEDLNTREALLSTVQGLRADLDRIIAEVDAERIVEPGSFEAWSFKDLIAHLTGWRLVTAARLEAGMLDREPQFPWPDRFDQEGGDLEEGNVDAINEWFYVTNRDKSLEQVLQESNDAFDRVEQAIATMPEAALLEPGQFDWLYWTDEALGPAVVRGTYSHYHEDHEPDIQAWLARG